MRRTQLLQTAASLAGVAAAGVSTREALSTTWSVFGDIGASGAVLGLVAGLGLLAAGLLHFDTDRDGVPAGLLAIVGTAWFISAWDDPYVPAWIFAAGRIVGTTWPVLLAHALLRMFGPLPRTAQALVALGYAATIGTSLAATALFNPATNGCAVCPANPLLLADAPGAAMRVEQAATLAGPFWSTLLLAALTWRLLRSTPARRRLVLPPAACGIATLALVAAAYTRAVGAGLTGADPALVPTESLLLIVLSISTGWPRLSLVLTRQRLARLVVQASAAPPIGGLGNALGAVLHDSSVRLLYPRDGDPRDLIDAAGGPASALATLTPLTRGAAPLAYVDHRSPLLDQDRAAIAHVARLSLENERLHAERAAQLRDLRESRVRIVAAADLERRRLERDLHDGAQQRLVSLALGLCLAGLTHASATGPDSTAILTDAQDEVSAALAELRTIARGLYPNELADEGLAAALETFAETDPTPVELDLDLPDRAPPAVESAAFFAAAHLLATTSYDPTRDRAITARTFGGYLRLTLLGSARTDDLTTVEDRVGAVGGTLARVDDETIRIELPCVS